jgi:hypothetical protein
MPHTFFQQFGFPGFTPPPQQLTPEDQKYLVNSLILEIASNWPFARWMMDQFRNGELKDVDPAEQDWLNFINGNNIDLEKYGKNSEQFVEELFQK